LPEPQSTTLTRRRETAARQRRKGVDRNVVGRRLEDDELLGWDVPVCTALRVTWLPERESPEIGDDQAAGEYQDPLAPDLDNGQATRPIAFA
jgi:hypothetical protein